MIAVDTCSFSSFLQGKSGDDIIMVEEAFKAKQLFLPPVVVFEILSDPIMPWYVEKVICDMPTLPIKDDNFWIRAAKTRQKLIQKKLKARLGDCFVAQICLDYDIPLITRDKDFRHFRKHCELKLL